jgi:hypothetical protein
MFQSGFKAGTREHIKLSLLTMIKQYSRVESYRIVQQEYYAIRKVQENQVGHISICLTLMM